METEKINREEPIKRKELASDVVRLKRRNKLLLFIVLVLLVLMAWGFFFFFRSNTLIQGSSVSEVNLDGEKVSLAELKNEIYPQFICACCGNTIDKCGCGMAQGMKEEINSLVEEGLSKEEIIVEAAKKFGLNSLADESLQEEVRKQIIKSAPKDRPKIVIEPEVYDFGEVSQAKGIVSMLLSVRNDGTKDLVITKMVTSCMCTTASIVIDGKEGPKFGMHNNPTDWSGIIKPGEAAQLKVYYDPNMHGDLKGLVIRTIDIFSNDPIYFQKQVRIELNQVS